MGIKSEKFVFSNPGLYNLIVSNNMTSATTKCWGAAAGGGSAGRSNGGNGGAGGFSSCIFPIQTGDKLIIKVGHPGQGAEESGSYGAGGGGGGLTGVFLNGEKLENVRCVPGSGGGGGGGRATPGLTGGHGGAGGGTGQNGGSAGTAGGGGGAGKNSSGPGGLGSSGGAAGILIGTEITAGDGAFGEGDQICESGAGGGSQFGGNGGGCGSDSAGGGGGGSGYYGGGGGSTSNSGPAGSGAGGGGGSGHCEGIEISSLNGNGINPPNTNDPDYIPGKAVGGLGGIADNGFGQVGNPALVILTISGIFEDVEE